MQSGLVFDIQHYALHDGPGIRTIVFLKGCPLRCLWCCNPESQRAVPELRYSAARCRSSLACVDACPRSAIRLDAGALHIDRGACGDCGGPCVDACPHGALILVGEMMSADQVMARVAADKPFYDNSGGGVTFSGGEPFAQPAFLEELLRHSKRLGIHTAVETCGQAPIDVLMRCEPFVDLFLYDVKVMDGERHRELTGVCNDRILENLAALAAKASNKLVVRVPVVPGCTDGSSNLEAIAALLRSLGTTRVELMPYHALGIDKYASLGREYRLGARQSPTADEMNAQ